MTYHNDNLPQRRHYVILDIETIDRTEDYGRYARLDPRPARLRWPFKQTCAAALLSFSVDDDGMFEWGSLRCWAGDDEAALVQALFDELRMRPHHTLVTWGGLNADLPCLRMAAMRHGLRLPRHLIHNARERGHRQHLDLCREMEAGGTPPVHLSEVATALDLPTKFGDKAYAVPTLLAEGRFARLKQIPVSDVITTALVLQSHLESHGELVSARAAQIVTLRQTARRLPDPRHAEYLTRVEQRLCREATAEAFAFIADAA